MQVNSAGDACTLSRDTWSDQAGSQAFCCLMFNGILPVTTCKHMQATL